MKSNSLFASVVYEVGHTRLKIWRVLVRYQPEALPLGLGVIISRRISPFINKSENKKVKGTHLISLSGTSGDG